MHLVSNPFLTILLLSSKYLQSSTPKYPYDPKLITEQNEINFAVTDKRGILAAEGTVYFVSPTEESTIVACRDKKFLWKVNAASQCGSASVHQAVRYLKLTSTKLEVIYGKHSFLTIKLSTGQVTCEGSD